ncbi:TonB-dependent receptor domain-containing protein [Xylanibacter ruminicola]|uniref:Carboxypeptidase regulatory-like domain-containing protein n=1 Tax=Xylanibacter ruminicola TaxID=839 RepID=A0A1M6RVC4_XYLRU|nr:TonB-dependent receptor [Xylanibacter ruminicola]SHK36482.1 Carboxypeptidase regulatory-like domain-containing protein [Xylanibacter ruminicola]
MKRLLTLAVAFLTISLNVLAQVTTSGITGAVMAGGEEAIGATVTAKHVPSGSVYRAVTNIDGHYTITGMKAGGPYEVEISYIGFQTARFTDIQLALGQNAVVDATLSEGSEMIQEIVVTAKANNTMRSDRSGAVTNLNASQMAAVPTIGRSMTDLMKMTPQSSSASGMAIGGGNYRQSFVTIDGASFNDSFGMEPSPLPGGGTPISLEALDQMTVSVTPYDVRQSGFTGGGINAVTKSGTNTFKGMAYTFLTSSGLKGNKIRSTELHLPKGHNSTFGLSIGGPIVQDKLFFFVNAEYEDNVTAGPAVQAGNGSTPYTATNRRPRLSELESLSNYLQNTYGITTGPWQDYNLKTPAYRVLARLDWNINEDHKFNVRFTKSNRKEANPASASRSIGSNRTSIIYGGNQNSYGGNTDYGMSSLSSRYMTEFRFTSVAAELNSKFGKLHNTLRGTYSYQDQPRSNEYGVSVPVVEIVMDNGQGLYPYWALTGDLFTYGNVAQTKTTVITDEINIMLGKHNLFGGLQYEHDWAANGYAQAGAGYYAFQATPEQVAAGDWASVFKPENTRLFGITYGNTPDHSHFVAKMSTNQWSLYFQDNMSLSDRFRLSLGVRFELPSYPSLKDNFNEEYYKIDFGGNHYRTDNVPKASISASPRVGFNWDITGEQNIILRGGSGLFIGRLPFVWLISAVGNSGMGQTSYIASQTKGIIPSFTTSQQDMLQQIGAQSKISVPSSATILSDDLRMPKTWKTSLAVDAKLPGDIDFTLEGIYNKDINPVVVANRDIYWDGSSTIDLGHGDVRHKMSYYDANSSAYVLENAGHKAYYVSLTAQLRKKFDFGLDLSASYTLSKAKTYTDGIGNQVASAYNNYRNSVNAVNDNELGYATYVAPNRLLISASYTLKESKNASSHFSLVYDGYQYGFLTEYAFSRFSYIFSANVNSDALAPANLIYVPASRKELDSWNFAESTYGANHQVYTADMQRDDFWAYIQQDDYLKNRTGQYAERGGAKMPWHHQIDFKFEHDMSLNFGKTKHTLQLGVDILNLPNFLNKRWGLYKQVTETSLLSYNHGKYTYNTVNGERHLTTFSDFLGLQSTYQIMFTIRYLFN